MKISGFPIYNKIFLAVLFTLCGFFSSNSSLSSYAYGSGYEIHPESDSSDEQEAPKTSRSSTIYSGGYTPGYVVRYAVMWLPYADKSDDELTDEQKDEIAAELAIRLEEYNMAVSIIKKRLEKLGHPVADDSNDDAKKVSKSDSKESPSSEKEVAKSSSDGVVVKKNDDMSFTLADGTIADASNGVLIVEHNNGSGTAFIAKLRNRYFIATNLHMILNSDGLTFKTKGGESLNFPDIVFIAKGQDAVLIPISKVPEGCVALEIMEDVSSTVKRGDSVVACGNSQGGEVLRRSPGEILAVGPSVLETSCAIFKGNSGSPIFHQKSGKVVGIISHAMTNDDKISNTVRSAANSPIKSNIRYFGQRIDSTKNWERMKISELNQQCKDLAIFHKKLAVIKRFEESGKILIFDDLNYADFNRISRILSGTASSMGAVKTARRQYYGQTADLLRQEVALIKARRFSSVFASEVDELIKAFDLHRDLCIEKERSQN